MAKVKVVSLSCLFILILGGLCANAFPAFGVPGNGTSITVTNEDVGAASDLVWSYTVTELSAPKNKNPFTVIFTLISGETHSFGGLRDGTYKVVETSAFGFITTATITSNKHDGSQFVSGSEAVVSIESSEGKTVTFTNNVIPAFSLSSFSLPPPDQSYSIPPLQPIPVQAAWDVDINDDGRLDLVLDKPTAIVVNLTGPTFPADSSVTVSVAFEGNVYYTNVQGNDLSTNPVVSYYPISPSFTGDKEITGIYQVDGGAQVSLTTTDVTVKDTISLSLYFAPLSKKRSYDLPTNPTEMMENSQEFIDATYPVKSVTAILGQSIDGSRSGSKRDPYSGMLADIQAVAQQAQLNMGGSAIGVAIVPPEYFAYHGFPGAAGVSFGPAVKGVIAVDGYWTVPAHEIAHTFGLYYGVPEEYVLPGNPFLASGVNSEAGEWENGYSFMSIADYRSTSSTWVNSSSTYEFLFSKTRMVQTDPEILLVSGVVKNDTVTRVEFPYDWIRMHDGFADTITPGDYSLNFIGSGDIPAPISFGLSFNMQISIPAEPNEGPTPIVGYGDGVESNETGFSFAIPYPPENVEAIQVLDNKGTILATYYMADVQSFGCSASLDGEEGSNDWYVSPVHVTITSFVDPTTTDPPISIDTINYILDEDGVVHSVSGGSAQLDITTDGNHTLEYWSVDGDNASRHHIQAIAIDQTPPTISGAPDRDANAAGWYSDDVTVSFTVSDAFSGIDEATVPDDVVLGEGASQSVTRSVSDLAGNTASDTVSGINIDKTAPTITINSPTDTLYIIGQPVVADWTASDSLSGISSASGTVASGMTIDTSTVGSKTFTVTAFDNAGNTGTLTINYNVGYAFSGFLTPVPDSQYKIGRTVPVKFELADSQGNSVTTGLAKIYVAHIADDGTSGPYLPGSTKDDTSDNIIRSAGSQYIFNLDTSSLSAGRLGIRVDLDDGTSKTVEIILK
jgi:hypothetical protein